MSNTEAFILSGMITLFVFVMGANFGNELTEWKDVRKAVKQSEVTLTESKLIKIDGKDVEITIDYKIIPNKALDDTIERKASFTSVRQTK